MKNCFDQLHCMLNLSSRLARRHNSTGKRHWAVSGRCCRPGWIVALGVLDDAHHDYTNRRGPSDISPFEAKVERFHPEDEKD